MRSHLIAPPFKEAVTKIIPSFADTRGLIKNLNYSLALKQDARDSLFMEDLYVSEMSFTITNIDKDFYKKMYKKI